MAELQNIRWIRWNGMAAEIGGVISFLRSVYSLEYSEKTLLIRQSSVAANPKTYQIEPNCYLIYSDQTGYQLVTDEIFRTFVKE